jgi:agmatinase
MFVRNNNTPTYNVLPTFMGVTNTDPTSSFCIAGIAYDFAVSNRPGARFGPSAIRSASRMLIDGDHPIHQVNPISLGFADVGNFDLVHSDILGSMIKIEEQADQFKHLICLGGDHSISLPLLRSLYKRHGPIGLVHMDAHIDTWPDNFGGNPYGHGNPFFHAINEGLVDPNRMIQIGIRSPVQNSVRNWTIQQGVKILSSSYVHRLGPDVGSIANDIRQTIQGQPCYLTIDIDVLDPAFAPGTGTPEIGGLTTYQVQSILRELTDIPLIGMDIVEVSPPYDVSEITALAAATFVWEYISCITKKVTEDLIRKPI